MVGRIYVGTVKQIRTNIQAAFVELGDGLMAYYPLEDWERFPVEGVAFREGAQIPVMVIKDAQKTKAPTVTTALTFTDTASIPAYATYYIQTMAAQGILGGYKDGSFQPHANITRGQMAKILYNLL